MTDRELWVCTPCYETVPQSYGVLYTHGGTRGRVWCPWCGDAMDVAGDVLSTAELSQAVRDLSSGITAFSFPDDARTDGGGRNPEWMVHPEVFPYQ